jgi:hypothetical protein
VDVLVEKSETTAPPTGAAPFKVTVAVDTEPPRTGDGENVTEYGIAVAVGDSVAVLVTPP